MNCKNTNKELGFDKFSECDKMNEKINVAIIAIRTPTKHEINILRRFFTVTGNSLNFFNFFLYIKNPSHSIKNMREIILV